LSQPEALTARVRARRSIQVILVLALGTAVALFAYNFARQQTERRTAAEFAIAAQDRYLSLRATVDQYVEQIESLAEFYAATPDFNRRAYRLFVQPRLARHTGISSLEWIPACPMRNGPSTRRAPARTSPGSISRAACGKA